ncbi:MAG: bifunctional glutamate N-acetyltransferase/amino-acid acetyltransferase ArgJ [Alphaproteobacteria bacterium]|nr:bifunctional glutamate N-acetyltransferase/amino-acid acetyltransferase ArgJ [Alphaproteobacteria bacterium]MBV9151989.1 bifunctional glutamate N-acetyltransferase/amino-acid acetyltransferase ArgJ [Alphaproteobacteria bacterium]MBV9968047.1 bifunctional glutamate N-acetyltransferase/amino-acid acetyltransferase ArgJ [Alphaproteobacteria bacterium]
MPAVSPLAPAGFPELEPIPGVRLAAYAAGVRYSGRNDVMLAELAPGTTIAGVLTQSTTPGAPVDWCRACLPGGSVRAIVVNSGNANVFTGRAGREVCERTAAAAAELFGCSPREVFISSTGVIGEPPPAEKIVKAIPKIAALLDASAWEPAARAIMTTDTFPKGATATASIGGTTVRINGFCKGSGMIAPDMATMLAYLFTDAALPPAVLQPLLKGTADKSFNCLTVDGDTSTSDTLLLCATGQARNAVIGRADDPGLADFHRALDEVSVDLAQQLARDGEGAEKFVTIEVTGAENDRAARRIGLSIGNSPLVKTAIAAGDANWGRIVMAVGKAGEKAERDRLSIAVGGIQIAAEGGPVPGYREGPVSEHMAGREIRISIDLGLGSGRATIWTCDLTHGYIDINGSYRS